MRIVWFTWKDKKHPFAGGAETVDTQLAKELVKQGHELILIVGGFPNGKKEEIIDGYKIIRVGNQFTVYFEAFRYFKKQLQDWPDVIIEEINTIPFMTQWYTKKKKILLIYQLCRKIWFYQLFFPLNIIGYLLEPIYLRMLNNNTVFTESESTKIDLQQYGFKKKKIHIFPISIDIDPLKNSTDKKTFPEFTILSLGSIRSMKRTLDQVKAFEIAKRHIPSLQMKISGALVHTYGKKFLQYIENSMYAKDIEYLGTVSKEKKVELMKKSHVILVTSVKEGWGLIVTEAGSQATPAIVYNVDGLRDSVIDGKTGIICKKNTPEELANHIITLYANQKMYNAYSYNTLKHNQQFTIKQLHKQFNRLLKENT